MIFGTLWVKFNNFWKTSNDLQKPLGFSGFLQTNFKYCCKLHFGITLFALVLHLNCTALNQSESSNFFMYVFRMLIGLYVYPKVLLLITYWQMTSSLQHHTTTLVQPERYDLQDNINVFDHRCTILLGEGRGDGRGRRG